MGYGVAETIEKWPNTLYAVRDAFTDLKMSDNFEDMRSKGKLSTDYRGMHGTLLDGLSLNGIESHLTLTGGPKDSIHWTYFHFSATMPNGHVFYVIDNTDKYSFSMTDKTVVFSTKGALSLKKAKEHNSKHANNSELAGRLREDIQQIVWDFADRLTWYDNTN